jgi:hypothetical protein
MLCDFRTLLKFWCWFTEHPSECNAERITFISPRGEINMTRLALCCEGCPVIPAGSIYPPSLPKPKIHSRANPQRIMILDGYID